MDIFQAVQENNIGFVREYINGGGNVNEKTGEKTGEKTLLHIAVQHDSVDAARLLLNNGADLNAKDRFNFTPMKLAELYGKDKIVALLSTFEEEITLKEGKTIAESEINKLSEERRILFTEKDNYLQLCKFGQELNEMQKKPYQSLDDCINHAKKINEIGEQISTFIGEQIILHEGKTIAEIIISELSKEKAEIFREEGNYLQLCKFGQKLKEIQEKPKESQADFNNATEKMNKINKEINTFREEQIALTLDEGKLTAESIISEFYKEKAEIFREEGNYFRLCKFGQQLKKIQEKPKKSQTDFNNAASKVNKINKEIDTFIKEQIALALHEGKITGNSKDFSKLGVISAPAKSNSNTSLRNSKTTELPSKRLSRPRFGS